MSNRYGMPWQSAKHRCLSRGGLLSLCRSFTTLSVTCLVRDKMLLVQRKQRGIKSEQTAAHLLPISVGSQCFGRRLPTVFIALLLAASTPWKARSATSFSRCSSEFRMATTRHLESRDSPGDEIEEFGFTKG